MTILAAKVRRLLISEDGPTAVEYAVLLALIIVVCVTAVQNLGSYVNTTFGTANTSLSGAS